MHLLITFSFISTLVIFASAAPTLSPQQDELKQCVADLANQLNQDIVHTTQFFEAFPTLDGSALTTQANAAEIALQDATGVLGTIALELSDNALVQVIKAELLDNDFLLNISLQFEDFAQDLASNPFSETLGLYCSDAILKLNNLFQITGNFVDAGLTIVALSPKNCPS